MNPEAVLSWMARMHAPRDQAGGILPSTLLQAKRETPSSEHDNLIYFLTCIHSFIFKL
jgi:hypothetical protein